MSNINIVVQTKTTDFMEQITISESVQELVKNLSVDNLKLLAEKSRKPNINKKIQQYKNLI